jgi:hypothetical protein
MPIQGFTRFRKHQLGLQSVIGTRVAATRPMSWRGAISINPNRSDPDVDVGSLDPVLAQITGAVDVEASVTGPMVFDELPYRWAAAGKGGVTSTGAVAKVWAFQLASLTADSFDYFSDEWGDDTADSASGGILAHGGVIDSFSEEMPEDLGVWTISDDWVYAGATFGNRTALGSISSNSNTFAYGADTEFYLDTTAGGIGGTKLTDDIHAASLSISNNLDRKRYANGSNTRFQLAGYGRGAREITWTLTRAKTTAALAEQATLDDEPVPTRFIEFKTTSPAIITGSTAYQYRRRGAVQLVSVEDGEIGGNTTLTFTYRGQYDATLGYAIRADITNTLNTF